MSTSAAFSFLYKPTLHALRACATPLLHAAYSLHIEGAAHVPKHGAALVVANHQSFHDFLFVGVAVGRPARFVMHHHHFRYPVLRTFLETCRVIPIAPQKEDPQRLCDAYDEIDRALANGEVVCLWPEGTMTPDGEVGPFRSGVERVLERAARRGQYVPLVPMGMRGLFGGSFSRAMGAPMQRWSGRVRAKVTVRVGAPMWGRELSADAIRSEVIALANE